MYPMGILGGRRYRGSFEISPITSPQIKPVNCMALAVQLLH